MANWATPALGDPSDPEWRKNNLTVIEPVPGQRWEVYKPAASAFSQMIKAFADEGYKPTSSGGFNYRNIRGSDRLSQHAYGTAIDLNAPTNPLGSAATDIPHAAEIAKRFGMEWGGNWQRPDPMHFEYAPTGSLPPAATGAVADATAPPLPAQAGGGPNDKPHWMDYLDQQMAGAPQAPAINDPLQRWMQGGNPFGENPLRAMMFKGLHSLFA